MFKVSFKLTIYKGGTESGILYLNVLNVFNIYGTVWVTYSGEVQILAPQLIDFCPVRNQSNFTVGFTNLNPLRGYNTLVVTLYD